MTTNTTTKVKKKRTGQDRRRQIGEAVIALAEEYGVHGVTTAKIAAKVGITEAGLYVYFDSREMMLREAIDLLYERDIVEVTDTSGAEDMIEHLLGLNQPRNTGRGSRLQRALRLKTQFLASPLSAELRERMVLGETRQFDAHLRMVEQGKAEGSIRQDVDARELVWDIYQALAVEGIPTFVLGLGDHWRVNRQTPLMKVLRSVAANPEQLERYIDRLEAGGRPS